MKKFIATLAVVLFTVVLTSYSNNGDDQIDGDNNSTQTQEPGAVGTVNQTGGGLGDVGGI